MRKGFTMIELIFVMVVIGILAAIAIPKLSATRADARHAKLVSNTKICINDLVGGYKGHGDTLVIAATASCIQAIEGGAAISYTSDSVRVSNVDTTVDGDHIFIGSSISL